MNLKKSRESHTGGFGGKNGEGREMLAIISKFEIYVYVHIFSIYVHIHACVYILMTLFV